MGLVTFPNGNSQQKFSEFFLFCFENAAHLRTWMRHKRNPSTIFEQFQTNVAMFFILDSNLSLNTQTDWIRKEKYFARTLSTVHFWRI